MFFGIPIKIVLFSSVFNVHLSLWFPWVNVIDLAPTKGFLFQGLIHWQASITIEMALLNFDQYVNSEMLLTPSILQTCSYSPTSSLNCYLLHFDDHILSKNDVKHPVGGYFVIYLNILIFPLSLWSCLSDFGCILRSWSVHYSSGSFMFTLIEWLQVRWLYFMN